MIREKILHFFNPPGRGLGIFFLKFFLFSIVALFIWLAVKDTYNVFLKDLSIGLIEDKIPILETRYYPEIEGETDKKNRGTLGIVFAPYMNGPILLKQPKPVSVELHLNTIHFNIIPFLALILASPFLSWKRLLIFILLGFVFLSCTHIFHIHLDLMSFYFKSQTFEYNPSTMAPYQLKAAQVWLYQNKFRNSIQGFMEQAGSMMFPALIWLIYASRWLLGSILPATIRKTTPTPAKTESGSENIEADSGESSERQQE